MSRSCAGRAPRSCNGRRARPASLARPSWRRIPAPAARDCACWKRSNVPRNRKKQSSAVRLVPALKAILLCVFVGGSAVGYVLQKNQVYELGRQMARREMLLERLKWENPLRANQLASLRRPPRLGDPVEEPGLWLGPSQ